MSDLEIDLERLPGRVAERASAEAVLRRHRRPPGVVLVVANVACVALIAGLLAMRDEQAARFIVGGVSGAALALAMLAWSESRHMRRTVDALVILRRSAPEGVGTTTADGGRRMA